MLPADLRAAKHHIATKICGKRSTVFLIINDIYSYTHKQDIATNDNRCSRKFRSVCGECLELRGELIGGLVKLTASLIGRDRITNTSQICSGGRRCNLEPRVILAPC